MRRVSCPQCGVRVEAVPWGCGKHQMTTAYVLFLAHWTKKLSWKEVALSFRTSWDKVCQAVEVVVAWGLEHRTLGSIQAIGVDEVAYGKGHKYLTLVYQIDAHCTRLLWVGRERTVKTFEGFLDMIGTDLSGKIEFVCSDMWKPYLRLIRERCSNALNILDRFHIVAKMNEALNDVRSSEARKLVAKTLRSHRELILNYFRAKKQFSSGVVEGLNNKVKVTMRKSYGFRTFRITELALYHVLGKLPEPQLAHRFY